MRELIDQCLQAMLQHLDGTGHESESGRRVRDLVRHRRVERVQNAGVPLPPEDLRCLAAGELQVTHSLRVVRAWHEVFTGARKAERCPRITALLGGTGCGKTMAGAWLVAEEGGVYVSALELRKRLVSGHWRDTEWAERVLRSRIVVLDDVGTESGDAEASAAVFELVNKRVGQEGGLTLITGNLSVAEFVERYGERTARRIEHAGVFIEAKGADLRRHAKRELMTRPELARRTT